MSTLVLIITAVLNALSGIKNYNGLSENTYY